jgi:hypothetical protein
MKAVFLIRPGLPHQALAAAGVTEGLARHGIEVITRHHPGRCPEANDADFVICWGWRIGRNWAHRKPTMVLERGYFGDRMSWTSIGWNGLNGRARFPKMPRTWEMFERLAPLARQHIHPWRFSLDDPTVIMGQVRGDAALEHCPDYQGWLDQTAGDFGTRGDVLFRPHPADQSIPTPRGAMRLDGSLHDALAIAFNVVTWNSNSAVDAVLAGVPTIVADRGSMAWSVAGILADPGARSWPCLGADSEIANFPNREKWFADLTMAQWTPAEIAAGDFWQWHAPILHDMKHEAAPAHV